MSNVIDLHKKDLFFSKFKPWRGMLQIDLTEHAWYSKFETGVIDMR